MNPEVQRHRHDLCEVRLVIDHQYAMSGSTIKHRLALRSLQAQVEFHGRLFGHVDEAADAWSGHAEFAPRERERACGLEGRSRQSEFDREGLAFGGAVN